MHTPNIQTDSQRMRHMNLYKYYENENDNKRQIELGKPTKSDSFLSHLRICMLMLTFKFAFFFLQIIFLLRFFLPSSFLINDMTEYMSKLEL